jgi:hypothetical protein
MTATTPHPSIDAHFVRSLREWRRVVRRRLREKGWGGKPVSDADIDRLADELLGQVFKPEWMEALRQSDQEVGGSSE